MQAYRELTHCHSNLLLHSMRFLDPMPCLCTSCGVKSALPVRDLLALTAVCPDCQGSFRDTGLSMRRTMDDASAFIKAIAILMHVEEQLGINIADETVEAIRPWVDLSLRDLATAAQLSMAADDSDASGRAENAVLAAVQANYPDAPAPPNFEVPLLDAIAFRRSYGA
jgi:hypothetical protein